MWVVEFVEPVLFPHQDFLFVVVTHDKILVHCVLCLVFSDASETALLNAFIPASRASTSSCSLLIEPSISSMATSESEIDSS